jgi:hypothetical protein
MFAIYPSRYVLCQMDAETTAIVLDCNFEIEKDAQCVFNTPRARIATPP